MAATLADALLYGARAAKDLLPPDARSGSCGLASGPPDPGAQGQDPDGVRQDARVPPDAPAA